MDSHQFGTSLDESDDKSSSVLDRSEQVAKMVECLVQIPIVSEYPRRRQEGRCDGGNSSAVRRRTVAATIHVSILAVVGVGAIEV